jgi:hypothetical protein
MKNKNKNYKAQSLTNQTPNYETEENIYTTKNIIKRMRA